ncbi:MAG: uracil phosphoribosyltransferase, partial [Candidatus Rokuibacteriota bacterium]
MPGEVHVVDHPLVQHKLSLMRMKSTSTSAFRNLLGELSMLMAYEVTRDLRTHPVAIDTPLARMQAPMLDGKKIALVSIMRAGTGILDGMLRLIPSARVGHVGLYRDPETLLAVEYYFKVPGEMGDRDVIVVDPMMATGNSAVAAVGRLKDTRPRSIKFVCLLTCPEGLANFHE